jgi:hypothetical protein
MVVGMVSAKGEARTAGVMHHVDHGRLWFTTNDREWKARHIAANRAVSVTVPIAKRVPFRIAAVARALLIGSPRRR